MPSRPPPVGLRRRVALSGMVGRHVRFTAQPGRGDELAALMTQVARSLAGTPGCRVYIASRDADDPDTTWMTELWQAQADVDAALEQLRSDEGKALLAEVMGLLAGPPQRTELQPLGGVGVD
jgi:quinol monooxygenase YgiN